MNCVLIFFEDQFVGIITQENGLENLKIEIYPPDNKKFWYLNFQNLNLCLNLLKKLFGRCVSG